ncbi:hypothetical protein PPL_00269 [Heterostelium album PN500]|uniref:Expansin-like EG45 domain-containing protein n=1 Tax=Heterostelium pallidum (strain ATCC 26659 / Pp 5 / PN500) TaxID=670386 RepID=D3AW02_HETP5|nr:hypothetical protein PPL_00269 [Heterostelium album PN500]EFA86475.1 hypothetical protein PPL_00269 [Heterostelium album PN500]|eukprot:XP_020438580.1 hypothetical protein PPL_00269 [Heterostelium album PN500]
MNFHYNKNNNILYLFVIVFYIFNLFEYSNAQYPSYLGPPYNFFASNVATGTFYTAVDNGNCGYGPLFGSKGPQTSYIAAINTFFFNHTNQCGQCYELSINGNTLTVQVVDQCPDPGWCDQAHSHFDLSPQAFAALQNQQALGGTMQGLNFRKVACNVNGNIKVSIKDGSNENWTAFLLFNHVVGIESVSILREGCQPEPLYRTTYNYWTQDRGTTPNYRLVITSILGETIVTEPLANCISNGLFDTGVQFKNFPQNGGTIIPTQPPTQPPTQRPTQQPTQQPPTQRPTQQPTQQPTQRPTQPTQPPTQPPTYRPNQPTYRPTPPPGRRIKPRAEGYISYS